MSDLVGGCHINWFYGGVAFYLVGGWSGILFGEWHLIWLVIWL